ncbi:MAG TPA: MarR family transcriptional regulator [Candidatus Dormibacteraeota bacterium]|nr:MarR family transcriptional regulator [Candidatus Dormibacteraeota bacterium]
MPIQSGLDESQPAARLRMLIGKLSRRLSRVQAGAGLTPTELAVLAAVARRGPLGLAELSSREGINPTMLSRIASKLGDGGLVARQTDPRDRRAAQLVATEQGRRLHRRIRAERNDILSQRLRSLPPRQRQLVIDALPALEALTEALLDPGA